MDNTHIRFNKSGQSELVRKKKKGKRVEGTLNELDQLSNDVMKLINNQSLSVSDELCDTLEDVDCLLGPT